MYKISKYSYAKAKKLNLIIKPSKNPKKKIDVFNKNGKFLKSIGAKGYFDYPSYLKKFGKVYADQRKKLYKQRHANNLNVKNSAGYFANQILW